jgi:SAM-dependent methyltransferase
MPAPSSTTVEQLVRQRSWLGESWIWLLQSKVFGGRGVLDRLPTALDVGCGPGLVMELFSPYLDVQGIDIDQDAVLASNGRGQRAQLGDAAKLPFEDGSFDIAYCSFLLLWTPDPVKVLKEMTRVSRDWVICLAEPDHRGRVSYPPQVAALDGLFVDGLKKQGADPAMGRKLQGVFAKCGLRPEVGVHACMWNEGRMRAEADEEFRSLAAVSDEVADPATLSRIRKAWDVAARKGTLVQYNPVFYAMARKKG